MEWIKIILTSVGSLAALFLLAKLIGNRQLSEMNLFDYINGITIGSIAAEMATSLETDFRQPLLAMVIYGLATVLIDILTSKSMKMRKLFTGETLLLLDRGKLYRKNLARARLDMDEFLAQCRVNGYFDVGQIQTAVMEPNGRLSILPRTDARPATPGDLGLGLPPEKPCVPLISDGRVMEQNLAYIEKDRDWLMRELKAQGHESPEEVFLAVWKGSGPLTVFEMQKDAPDKGILQ